MTCHPSWSTRLLSADSVSCSTLSCPLSPTVSKASAGTLEVFPVYSVPADSCRRLLQLLADRRWQLLVADTAAETGSDTAAPIDADTDTLLVVGT